MPTEENYRTEPLAHLCKLVASNPVAHDILTELNDIQVENKKTIKI